MNVKGLKINDILNIDLDTFNNMNESDLRHITSRLVSAGNKRIRRLEEKNINTPAYFSLGKEKKFTTKLDENVTEQQRVNQLRHTFAKLRSFMTSETSTIGGYNKFVKRTRKRIAKELNIPEKTLKDKIDIGKLFDTLHKLQERGVVNSYRGSVGSTHARDIIAEMMINNENVTEENVMKWIEESVTKAYEEEQEKEENELNNNDLDDYTII